MRTSILCWAGALLLALPACGDDTETDPPDGCTTDCPAQCGNGAVDPGEACDGADLGGQTCEGLGSPGGTLACTATCTLDTSGCAPTSDACGDGAVNEGEPCDGADLGGQTCEGLGFDGGTLTCAAGCTVDTSGCVQDPEVCGNGQDEDDNGLADCLDPACTSDPACTGESCSAPLPLVDGMLTEGDTTGGTLDTEGICAGYSTTPARVFAFTAGGPPGETGALHVSVQSEVWHGVYVRTDCEDGGSEIACVPFYDYYPAPTQVDVALAGGETVYIYVDGFFEPSDAGPFTIAASWEPIGDEDLCDDFQDNDFDGLIDCAEPSCQATADCQPGTGLTGAPCDASNQCVATGNDPLCFTAAQEGWPEGYCSEYCDIAADDCPSGATCMDPGNGGNLGFCLDECATHDDCREGYHCSPYYQGCYPGPAPEICDNGVDDDGNGEVDCDDPQCANYPFCPEQSCDNFHDDDYDGALDCDDLDCQPTPACVPGAGAAGVPCNDSTECAANESDPICLAPVASGWPMGYCSEFCDVAADDCPSGSLCVEVGLSTNGLCLAQCTTTADCRSGYYCNASLGNVCVVITESEVCDNGADDNSNGLIDCEDPACQNDPSCPELLCDDLSDNDSDGLLDCQDPTCQATATCAPGMGAAGAACAAASDCAADASDPFCITEAWVGWPGGYCSQFCDLAGDDCPSGAVCLDAAVSPTGGICFDLCTSDADCRAGYHCLDVGGGVNICLAG